MTTPSMDPLRTATHRQIIDVEQIVEELRERAAQRRAAGELNTGILEARLDIRPERITLRPEVAYSAKPVIGPFITGAKRLLIRLQYHFLDDVIAQTNRSMELARAQADAEIQRRKDLERRIAELERRLAQAEDAQGPRIQEPPDHTSSPPS